MLGFGAACVARLGTFSQLFGGHEAIDQLAWALARASGFVAFLAATGTVVLGSRRRSALPIGGLPARIYALHRVLDLASVLALAAHLSSLWLDSFVQFAWGQLLFAPWTSGYRPFAVTLGWLAMMSLLLTAASGGLRRLLPGWRTVHALAYLTFALGLVHGLMAGSASGSAWALAFYGATLLAVAWTLTRRFKRPSGPCRGAREVERKEPSAGAGQAHEGLGGMRVRSSYQSSSDADRAYTVPREPALLDEARESRPGRPASAR
jgi:sulfoxide reductase heme-binding subunit YedZ